MRGSIELLKSAIKTFMDNPVLFIGIYIVPGLAMLGLSIFMEYQQNYTFNFITPSVGLMAGAALAWVVVMALNIFMAIAMLQAVINNSLSVQEAYKKSVPFFWSYVLLAILVGLTTTIGFILLIIPGIIFFVWFAFSYYVLLIEEKKGIEAMKRSKELVDGRWFQVFGRLVMLIIFGILAGIVIGIVGSILGAMFSFMSSFAGDVVASIVAMVSNAVLVPISVAYVYQMYRDLKSGQKESAQVDDEPQDMQYQQQASPESGEMKDAMEGRNI